MVDQEIFLRRLEALRGYLTRVHDYLRIDHGLAWDAISRDLADIEAFYAWAVAKIESRPP